MRKWIFIPPGLPSLRMWGIHAVAVLLFPLLAPHAVAFSRVVVVDLSRSGKIALSVTLVAWGAVLLWRVMEPFYLTAQAQRRPFASTFVLLNIVYAAIAACCVAGPDIPVDRLSRMLYAQTALVIVLATLKILPADPGYVKVRLARARLLHELDSLCGKSPRTLTPESWQRLRSSIGVLGAGEISKLHVSTPADEDVRLLSTWAEAAGELNRQLGAFDPADMSQVGLRDRICSRVAPARDSLRRV